MYVYANKVAYMEHIALVKGDIGSGDPPLVRMHAVNLFQDTLGAVVDGKTGPLHGAMELIGEAGRGIVVLIREWYPTIVSDRVHAANGETSRAVGRDPRELRDYGIGAQILLDLGVHDMILLSNTPKKIVGIHGYGLNVVEHRPIPVTPPAPSR